MESDRPTSFGGDDDDGAVDELRIQDLRQKLRRKSLDRLRAKIAEILRLINTPLADIIRDHALPHLPVASLLRFRSVSASWDQIISSPIFALTQSRCHRSISGVFSSATPSRPLFEPFDPVAHALPDPSLSFLPSRKIIVRSSSNGLLCCFVPPPLRSYFVCNPATAAWAEIPPPTLYPGPDPALALIFEPSVYNLDAHYKIVIAFQIAGGEGVYGFQTFSSDSGAWVVSSEVWAAEGVIADSAVSVGGAAYWRTTMQTVLGYDPVADAVWMVPWPVGYEAKAQWELGEMDGRLCCAAVTPTAAAVYGFGPSNWWTPLASFDVVETDGEEEEDEEGWKEDRPIVFRERPRPLRFQSGNLEALFWIEGRVVGVDLARRRVRTVRFEGPGPGFEVDYVSHINTLAPVVLPVASSSAAVGSAGQSSFGVQYPGSGHQASKLQG